jgi:hypothetical protein
MEYNGRAKGCKTKDEGHIYTGEFYVEEGVTWYIVENDEGMPYETREEPVEYIDLTNMSNVLFATVLIPNDERIYNRMRPDGTFPSLDGFFDRE